MKVGNLVKLKKSTKSEVDQSWWSAGNWDDRRGIIIEALCHPTEPKDDEHVVVVWAGVPTPPPPLTQRIPGRPIRFGEVCLVWEIEVVNESG